MEPELIRAEITGVSGGLYSWEERTTDYTTGADVVPASVRKGTTSLNPAVEINGAAVPTGTKVWLRRRGYVGGGMRWEFQYEPGGGTPFVPTAADARLSVSANLTLNVGGQDIPGVSITLPATGLYFVYGRLTCQARASALTFSQMDLSARIGTGAGTGSDIGGTVSLMHMIQQTGVYYTHTTYMGTYYSGAASAVLRLQLLINTTAGTLDFCSAQAAGYGGTSIGYTRLS